MKKKDRTIELKKVEVFTYSDVRKFYDSTDEVMENEYFIVRRDPTTDYKGNPDNYINLYFKTYDVVSEEPEEYLIGGSVESFGETQVSADIAKLGRAFYSGIHMADKHGVVWNKEN